MLSLQCLVLVNLGLVNLAAARGWHHSCPVDLSDGPNNADVEIRIGNLQPSTAGQPVYLHWWAAKKSKSAYKPLQDISLAEIYSSGGAAYAEHGDSDFNGGKVEVSSAGEATVRVQAPATYRGHHGGSSRRNPHVHLAICGDHGHSYPKKLEFTQNGVYIKGGCGKYEGSSTVSYRVISAQDLSSENAASSATVLAGATSEADTPEVSQDQDADTPQISQDKAQSTEKTDWDALEFSPVYACLEDAKLFDQFSSACASQCPAHADLMHGQCVRQVTAQGKIETFKASWRLQLDCNDKCWADAVTLSHHRVRLELADHLDITFQEVEQVLLLKDEEAPTTHAHLTVNVKTSRLDADLGSSLVTSFLANGTFASELLGLTVHAVEQNSDNTNLDETGAGLTESSADPGEKSDEYVEYYAPLEKEAEQQAQARMAGADASIAGIPVPESVPVAAIIGVAVGIVVLLILLGIGLWCRRLSRREPSDSSVGKADKVQDNEVATDEKAAV